MSSLGGQTITCVAATPGSPDDLGVATITLTRTDVGGCLHRSVVPAGARGGGEARAEENTELGLSVSTSWWHTTAPPVPAVLALKPSDVIEVVIDGETLQFVIISGVHRFYDFAGRLHHVKIVSERQEIG